MAKRLWPVLIALLACGLIAAGCGDDDDEGGDEPTATEETTTTTTRSEWPNTALYATRAVRTLGFDTSTGELSVALASGATVHAERRVGPDERGKPRHARALLLAIEEVLEAEGGWPAVERIAVGVGPGTFTGLRIGVATARALAQARGLGLAGISSLAALAAGADEEDGDRPRLAAIDAKRGELFTALFGPGAEELWPARVGPPEDVASSIARLDRAPLAVGSGSVRFREPLEAAGAVVPADDHPAHAVRARHLCRLADAVPDEREVEPNYLRRPDAELWRERDHGTRGG